MSVTNDAVMERWQYHVRYGRPMVSKQGVALSTNGHNILAKGDVLYSYGTHFVLARVNRDANGNATCLLLNGDRYSVTTSKHQSTARSACAWLSRDMGIPSLIVPFSALAAAGVRPGDVMPIDVRDDRTIVHHLHSVEKPGERHVLMDDPTGATKTETQWRYGDASVGFKATQVEVEVPLRVPDPNHVYVGRSPWITAQRGDDGVWRWERHQHLLGDSLFKARVRRRVNVKPTPEQRNVFEQYRALVDERERLQKELSTLTKFWRRRGMPSETRDYRQMFRDEWKREVLTARFNALRDETTEGFNAVGATMRGDHTWGHGRDGLAITRQQTRHPIFLSSFDYQESTPLYFLCELPHGARPTTVEDAIEALKPPEVLAAEARGLTVTRQGDLFAIPTRLNKRQLRRLRNARHDFEKKLRVLGTNHSVSEGVIARGGAVFGRGIMRHEPDGWRRPDHARQRMGDGRTWHMLVRNTVPRQ